MDRTVHVRCVRKGKSLLVLRKGIHCHYCCLLTAELYSAAAAAAAAAALHNYSDLRRCEHRLC